MENSDNKTDVIETINQSGTPKGATPKKKTAAKPAKGGDAESGIKPAPESPKTAEEKRRAAMAARIFERRNVDSVFFTSDGIPFGTKSDALKQAEKLTDKTIIEYKKQL